MAAAGRPPRRSRPLLRTTLGDVLRRTRREQGRTPADVARAAKVSMPYLSEVERGRKEASSEVLAAICDALRIDVPDLLGRAGRDLAGRRAPDSAPPMNVSPLHSGVHQIHIHVRRPDVIRPEAAPPVRGPGDARCLLAA